MYLKACKRRKNGKEHRYFSVVESRRLPGGKVFQRQVLYLGEINDSQQTAWRRTLSVVGQRGQEPQAMSLFPDDRPLPPDAVDAVQVRMSEMVLRRPRAFGDCWLGCDLWRQLQWDRFWHKRLGEGKEQIPWAKVLQLLVVNRLIDPGSEFRVHRRWFAATAMDGYSRDGRGDGRQVGIALIVTPAGLPWQKVRDDVQVKLLAKDGEVYVLAKSDARRRKEHAMRRRRLRTLWDGLVRLRHRAVSRDELLKAVTLLTHEAGWAAALVDVRLPPEGHAVTAESFRFALRKDAFRAAWRRDGAYILRGTLGDGDPSVLWQRYMLLTEIEAAFKCLKSELAIRPVHHQLEHRAEAHILVAFLGYCLMVTLKLQLEPHAPGLTPRSALEKLSAIQMVDVWLPTTDGRWLVMPRHTQPEPEQRIVLDLLGLSMPAQPPPRITSRDIDRRNHPLGQSPPPL